MNYCVIGYNYQGQRITCIKVNTMWEARNIKERIEKRQDIVYVEMIRRDYAISEDAGR